jgi:Domain of unknown function (DUF4468) with TBP-like fold
MRKLLIIPALLFAGICFGQNLELPYDTITGRLDYKQITQLSKGSQDAIFSNVLHWLDKKYKPLIDTVNLMDKTNGHIVLTATLTEALNLPATSQESYLEHMMTIDVKGNKCRMQMSDLRFKEYFPETEFTKACWKDVPIEGIVLGMMNDKFCSANAKAYKKYLIAEDIEMKAIMQSLDQFLLAADKANVANEVNACNEE